MTFSLSHHLYLHLSLTAVELTLLRLPLPSIGALSRFFSFDSCEPYASAGAGCVFRQNYPVLAGTVFRSTFLFDCSLVLCSSINTSKCAWKCVSDSGLSDYAKTAAFKIPCFSRPSSQFTNFELAWHYHDNLLTNFPNTIFDGHIVSVTGRNEKLINHNSPHPFLTLVHISEKFQAELELQRRASSVRLPLHLFIQREPLPYRTSAADTFKLHANARLHAKSVQSMVRYASLSFR